MGTTVAYDGTMANTRIGHGNKSYRRTFIRAWREHRGLTQDRLIERLEAAGVEMSKASLSRVETAQQAYTQPMLEAIADALGLEPQDLLMLDPKAPDVAAQDDFRSLPADQRHIIQEIVATYKKASNL